MALTRCLSLTRNLKCRSEIFVPLVKTTSFQTNSFSSGKENAKTEKGQTVVSDRRGSVVTVAINRPEARNAVNQETARRLLEELQAFDTDPDLSVAVLHGKGGNFCAGYDLKELANRTPPPKLEQDVTKGPGPMGPSRLQLSKPLIAAVSGFAVAGGLELALLADLRVVEESAVMGVFCRRFGVPLIDGGTVRLPRLIGLSRALDLILTGRPVGAQEALAYGLANRVVPDGQGPGCAELTGCCGHSVAGGAGASRADQRLPSAVSASRPLLSHVQLLRCSRFHTGHAVRSRPRPHGHSSRVRSRGEKIQCWSWTRREIRTEIIQQS